MKKQLIYVLFCFGLLFSYQVASAETFYGFSVSGQWIEIPDKSKLIPLIKEYKYALSNYEEEKKEFEREKARFKKRPEDLLRLVLASSAVSFFESIEVLISRTEKLRKKLEDLRLKYRSIITDFDTELDFDQSQKEKTLISCEVMRTQDCASLRDAIKIYTKEETKFRRELLEDFEITEQALEIDEQGSKKQEEESENEPFFPFDSDDILES